MDTIFDQIKHYDESKQDYYWDSRKLCSAMGYSSYQKFSPLIDKAKKGIDKDAKEHHFTPAVKKVDLGSGSKRDLEYFRLTKTACYEIACLADAKKEEVKEATKYFSPHTLNQHYIKEYTDKANKFYLDQMAKLDDVKALVRDDTFNKNDERIKSEHHMMYKLGTLFSKDGRIGYEFLIEYDKRKPSVGIYYGCKAFVKGKDLDEKYLTEQIDRIKREWGAIENEVCEVLNHTFPGKKFNHRFKVTDNRNYGNFWPFWITLYEDEEIVGVAVRAIRIIRKIYEKYIIPKDTKDFQVEQKKQNSDDGIVETVTAFTEDAYKGLCDYISKGGMDDQKDEINKYFKEFLDNAVNYGALCTDDKYEKVWKLRISNIDFVCLVAVLITDHICKKYSVTVNLGSSDFWEHTEKVFLGKDGKPFGKRSLYVSWKRWEKEYDEEKKSDRLFGKRWKEEVENKWDESEELLKKIQGW